MGKYIVTVSEKAKQELSRHYKSGNKVLLKRI